MKCADRKYVALSPEDQSNFAYEFEKFEPISTNTDYTLIAIGSHPDAYKAYERIVLMAFELPNCLVNPPESLGHYSRFVNDDNKFVKILTQCPFSVEYFNKLYNYDKLQWVYHPFNLKYLPEQTEKVYDVYYTGNIFNPISSVFPIMRKYKYCITSYNGGDHLNVSYVEKLKLNAQSKISIVHGLLNWRDETTADKFPGHKAFELAKEYKIVPQIKTRTIEAAAAKSLILSLHDPWNMIESYFEPGVDFIYWYNEKDLEEKINHILSHYDDYLPMIEHAYNKLITNYSTQQFFNTYLKGL